MSDSLCVLILIVFAMLGISFVASMIYIWCILLSMLAAFIRGKVVFPVSLAERAVAMWAFLFVVIAGITLGWLAVEFVIHETARLGNPFPTTVTPEAP